MHFYNANMLTCEKLHNAEKTAHNFMLAELHILSLEIILGVHLVSVSGNCCFVCSSEYFIIAVSSSVICDFLLFNNLNFTKSINFSWLLFILITIN